jgi:hypothetical protein
VIAGPLTAAFLAGLERALVATALGSLAGALVRWRIPTDRALKFETHVKGGKFLVVVRGQPEVVARARGALASHAPEHNRFCPFLLSA